ncbi:MAG: class I SAM-dependent methyltransferase [Gemmatimonadaceae bacterium]|nr:class I SAM-dependent methyltransferase [Gemmatimonadaceae bacterium]
MTGDDAVLPDPAFSYDAIAANYARNVDTAPYNALYERPAMLGLLPPIEGARILDAGCGSGWYAEQLLARGATVDAIDASAAMVAFARERLMSMASDVASRLTVQVANLDATLPFAGATFDGVVSPLVLHYISDWRPALREMLRVLKPQGWLQFSTHHPAADAALFETRNYFGTEHVVDHWDWVGNVEFYRRSLTEICASLDDAGFVIEKLVEPVPVEAFRAAEPDSWARLMSQPEFLIVRARPRT